MSNFQKFLTGSPKPVNEVFNDNGFKLRSGINISKKEIDDFFAKRANKSYKALRGDFLKDFNDYFGVQTTFQIKDIEYIKNNYVTMTSKRGFIVNELDNGASEQTTSTKISQLSKGKTVKFKVPVAKGNKLDKFVKTVILNMRGASKGKLLLTGDPGTGKTSTIKTVIALLKLNLVIVEAPHISEENIISVPYLIKRGVKEENATAEYTDNGSGFDVINAESNLITTLKKAKPIRDNEYNMWLNANKLMAPLADKYKRIIDEKIPYTNVLFIDEFYRTGNKRIQNLFRTILNGNIGTTPIPANTYIIYASNMDDSDGSLDTISLNQQFNEIGFDKPSKADFMRYMADNFTNVDVNTGEEDEKKSSIISKDVYNAFLDSLTDDELGGKDESTEAQIRISPRRWEEIIKYVSNSLPPADANEAAQLLTFLRDNMSDYTTGEVSQLFEKYEKIVKKLMNDSGDIDTTEITPIDSTNWRDNFEGQLRTKLKMGGARKYMPVISGKPGIGKTALIDDVARKYNLRKIVIDASVLEPEDVIGLTTPAMHSDGTMSTEFTTPPLYKLIMAGYKPGVEPEPGNVYTHILFLDELSRTNTKVFNGLRALMLDKKVGPKKIPDDIMIIGAMNPFDSGTSVLTDHMKDVVDVIQADGNINETYDFFEKCEIYKRGNSILGIELSDVVMGMFKETVDLFKSDVDVDGESLSFHTKPFYWTDGLNVVYISPREFQDLILGSIEDCLNSLEMENDLENKNDFNIDDVPLYVDTVQEAIRDKYTSVFKFILSKQKLTETDFMEKYQSHVDAMILRSTSILTDAFNTIKSDAVVTLASIFERAKSVQEMLDYPDIKNILENIIENNDVNDIISDIQDIVADTTHNNEVVDIFDALVDVYKLLSKVDWSKYSAEITANISTSFIEYSIKPTVETLKNNGGKINGIPSIEYIETHMSDFESFKTMFEHAKTNKTNMFY